MAINLRKGEKMDLGLTRLTLGLGWDPNAGTGQAFDLDVSVFALDGRGLLPNEGSFVFYNNPQSPDGALEHVGDDRSGGSSDGDDEVVKVDLDKIAPGIQEILFLVTIHDYDARRQNFGQVRNAYIRILDQTRNDEEIAKYELDEDFSVESAVEFGRLYKRGGSWRFQASGIGLRQDLGHFVEKYSQGFQVTR